MNICIITPQFVTEPYFYGGIAQQFYKIAKWEVVHDHRVDIITPCRKNEDIIYEGIYVHRITSRESSIIIRILNKLTFHKLKITFSCLSYSYSIYRKVKQLHSVIHFDIIQSVNFGVGGLISLLLLSIPFVLRAASYRPTWNKFSGIKNTLDLKLYTLLELIYYRLALHIFAPSIAVQKMLIKKASIKNVRVIRTPFYTDVVEFDDSIYQKELKGKIYLLFFGWLEKRKGVHILGQALPEVFLKIPDSYAVFVGTDYFRYSRFSMRQYITDLCNSFVDRVIFINPLTHEQLYPIIKESRLVVLPSLVDNLPNAMLEAMGLGKVVLGTIGCSFDEVIEDGKNGFLVNPGKPHELAQKIIEIWDRKDLDEIGKNAACKIKDFAPDKVIPQIIDYYQEVIDEKRKKHV